MSKQEAENKRLSLKLSERRSSLAQSHSQSTVTSSGSNSNRRRTGLDDLNEMIDGAFYKAQDDVASAVGSSTLPDAELSKEDQRWISKHQKSNDQATVEVSVVSAPMPFSVVATSELRLFSVPLHVLFGVLDMHNHVLVRCCCCTPAVFPRPLAHVGSLAAQDRGDCQGAECDG